MTTLNDELLQIELDMYQSIEDQTSVFTQDLNKIYDQIRDIGKDEYDF